MFLIADLIFAIKSIFPFNLQMIRTEMCLVSIGLYLFCFVYEIEASLHIYSYKILQCISSISNPNLSSQRFHIQFTQGDQSGNSMNWEILTFLAKAHALKLLLEKVTISKYYPKLP